MRSHGVVVPSPLLDHDLGLSQRVEDLAIERFIAELAVALGWSLRKRALIGMGLAGILLIPGMATLWMAWARFNMPVPPEPLSLSITGLGALASTGSFF